MYMIYNVVLVSDIQQMTHDSNIYIYVVFFLFIDSFLLQVFIR